MTLVDRIAAFTEDATALRRDLHAHPELGYQEHRTHDRIVAELERLGIAHRPRMAGGTGVLGFLPATGEPRGTVALRADIDALPISEETGVPHASQNPGVMHACGHDGHTAILLTAARALSESSDRPNNVLFLFQPAEEGGAGGRKMVLDGALNGRHFASADVVFGLHGYPDLDVGDVSTRPGPIMASAAEFAIEVVGKGAHAAYPHFGVDPIVAASAIVGALQTVASRTIDPLDSVVVTVGQFVAGVAHNVIPDRALLRGTLRTLHDATYATARARIEELVAGVAAGFGAEASVEWRADPYPVTRNHLGATERFFGVAQRVLGAEKVHVEAQPSMGGEDFAFYGQAAPACFFFLGLRQSPDRPVPNLHSPRFDFTDAAIPVGARLMAELALDPDATRVLDRP